MLSPSTLSQLFSFCGSSDICEAHVGSREDLRQSQGLQKFGGGGRDPILHHIVRLLGVLWCCLPRTILVRIISSLLIYRRVIFERFCSRLKKPRRKQSLSSGYFLPFFFNLSPPMNTHNICWLY